MKHLSVLVFIFSVLVSCKPSDPYQYQAGDKIELKKDPCFGFCPVYQFTIDGKGNAVFMGNRNVQKVGTWKRILGHEETNHLFQSFEASGFFSFRDEYVAEVTDLPTTWVTFRLGDQEKTIKDYYDAPKELKELEKNVEIIAESEEGWEKVEE